MKKHPLLIVLLAWLVIALALTAIFVVLVHAQEMGKPTKGGTTPGQPGRTASFGAGAIPTFGPFHSYGILSWVEAASCPDVTISAKAGYFDANAIKFHCTSSPSALVHFRYRAGAGAWTYSIGADSTGHTLSVAGLAWNTLYEVQVNAPGACDTSYSASTNVTTGCPTLAFSSIAAQAVTSSGATLHAHVSSSAVVHFRLHSSPSGAWSYYSNDDSTQATRAVTGLSPHAGYAFQMNGKSGTCDTTAFGDSTGFTTLCPTITQSGFHAYATSTTTEKITWTTNYATSGNLRMAGLTGPYNGTYSETGADSATHYYLKTALAEGNSNRYQVNGLYAGCDSNGWSAEQYFVTACATQPSATWSTDPPPVCCLDESLNQAKGIGNTSTEKMCVEYKLHSGSDWTTVCSSSYEPGNGSITIPTLTPSTSYDVRFRWLNPCGTYSSYSTTQTKTTDSAGHFPDACGGV